MQDHDRTPYEVDGFPPYTEADWERDIRIYQAGGGQFTCPNCDCRASLPLVGPRMDERRHYYACKACGFWQEADGSKPYRGVWMTVHECSALGELFGAHLHPWDDSWVCPYCKQTFGRESRALFPQRGRVQFGSKIGDS